MADRFIQVENNAGKPRLAGTSVITPIARSLTIRLPGLQGGLIWNRPVSVVVTDKDGQEQVLPVRDVTRLAQLFLFGLALAGSLAFWLSQRNHR
jgi:hypothetical protein